MIDGIGWLVLAAVQATTVDPLPMPPVTPMPAAEAATPVEPPIVLIAIDRELSSKVLKPDEFFPIRLAQPLMLDGRTVLPAGLTGEGQVVHVSKATGLGKGGELIVAARYLQCGTERLGLRGFRLDGAGKDKSMQIGAAYAVAGVFATPVFFIKGSEYGIPLGAVGHAKLVGTVPPVTGDAAPCAVAAPVATQPAPAVTAATAPTNASQQGVTK